MGLYKCVKCGNDLDLKESSVFCSIVCALSSGGLREEEGDDLEYVPDLDLDTKYADEADKMWKHLRETRAEWDR